MTEDAQQAAAIDEAANVARLKMLRSGVEAGQQVPEDD